MKLGLICFILGMLLGYKMARQHGCVILKKSSKGITGMILKCEECGSRYKILWEDYKEMHKGVNLGEEE